MNSTLYIDLDILTEQYKQLKRSLPEFQIFYALKANPHSAIVQKLKSMDASFEVASWEEIEYLQGQDVCMEDIIFSNPVKPIDSIYKAISNHIKKLVFDSEEELEKFKWIFKDMQLFLRISVSNKGSRWALNKKFGASEGSWPGIFQKMRSKNLSLAGITFHVGSQCESLKTWDMALKRAIRAIQMSHAYGLRPHILNVGGGFPIQFNSDIPSIKEISYIIKMHTEKWNQRGLGITQFAAEPGRYLISPAGILETEIIGTVKKNNKYWVYLSSGLFSGMLESINERIRYPIKSNKTAKLKDVILCGPTCDSLDILYKALIPDPVVGDKLYFLNTGGYTHVYASNFNGFNHPAIEVRENLSFLTRKEFNLKHQAKTSG